MRFFQKTILFKRLKNIAKLSQGDVFQVVFNNPSVKDLIIEMNTQEQLFEKGIDSKGTDLKAIGGDYSSVTKDIKSYFNQPYDRITLKDTGDFYRSFTVRASHNLIIISADTIKDDDDLTDRWGDDILGLTPESTSKLARFAKDFYIKELKRLIWK